MTFISKKIYPGVHQELNIMEYGIWNQTKNPVGIVQIICDTDAEIKQHEQFARTLNKHRYQVFATNTKRALDFMNTAYNLPIFLIGIGNAAKTVQNMSQQDNQYSGGISIMARTSLTQKIKRACPIAMRHNNKQKIPLLVIGGWDAVKQVQSIVNSCEQNDSNLGKVTLVVYPEIREKTAFEIAQNEILDFLSMHR
jgi:diacylglycerol kinase family enzyme